VSTILSKIR